jgi:DNA repair protein RadC
VIARVPVAVPARRVRLPATARRRLLHSGAASCHPAELLTLVGSLHPDDAAELLAASGGLGRLAGMDAAELTAQGWIGPAAAAALAAAFELGRRVACLPSEPGWRVRQPADVGERMLPAMRHLEREELRTLLLNTKNVVTAQLTVYGGNLAGAPVRVGEVFRDAVRRQAAAVVVVHNHPSGDPTPSADDLRITSELADAGRLLDIELLDHVVVADQGWVSIRSIGGL